MGISELLLLLGFLVLIGLILFIDLFLVGKQAHLVSTKEALAWSVIWFLIAMGFYLFLRYYGHLLHGIDSPERLKHVISEYAPNLLRKSGDYATLLDLYRQNMSINYMTGYFIEETLSVDNLFVILLILQSFGVQHKNYKTVLFWGILGAIVLRFIFIFAGAALIHQFHWILYIFGAFLIFQGIKILFEKNEEAADVQDHPVVKYLRNHFSIYPRYVKDHFFVHKGAKRFITPLLIVVVMIEFSDLVFAMDSIPAVFAVTSDPYVVFFSNIFAIIGLRSLFFLLANIITKFRFLKAGVSLLLVFVGVKLLAGEFLTKIGFESQHSLFVILGILSLSVLLSVLFPKKENG
ncbi:MAG: TerC/Alx family metal homeostasis membrane protein [Bacteroidota bacterium]|nr:TerC/Alx family metal homeostasis membrane protein [Bacteroidota bacterium]MDP4205263.1 TerC/Alx family metal homeostasis membrane protein [Bacteroidota bacterium]